MLKHTFKSPTTFVMAALGECKKRTWRLHEIYLCYSLMAVTNEALKLIVQSIVRRWNINIPTNTV
jgi:hypothetical protein